MENLSISDPPPQHGGPPQPGPPQQQGGGPMPPMPPLGRPGPQQLPAQYFTTAAQLLDLTDKKLMLSLRDGRKMIGILRTWDQFANLVLQSTVERMFVPPTSDNERGLYADIPVGVFLVRGENVVLLGEIDLDKDDDDPPGYDQADPELVKRLIKERRAQETKKEKRKTKKLSELGFLGENMGELLL